MQEIVHCNVQELCRWVFDWVTDGRSKNLVKWEGKDRWINEQIGFLRIILIQAMFFLCFFQISLFISPVSTQIMFLVGLMATLTSVYVTRKINVNRNCSMVESLDLHMLMQAIVSMAFSVFLHIFWGGLYQSRNSNILLISIFGPFAMLQIAGSYYPTSENQSKKSISNGSEAQNPFRRSSSSLETLQPSLSEASSTLFLHQSSKKASTVMVRNGGILALHKSMSFNNTERLLARRMRPVYWTLSIRTVCVVVLACVDEHLEPFVRRPPWAVALASIMAQLCVLAFFVVGTRVRRLARVKPFPARRAAPRTLHRHQRPSAKPGSIDAAPLRPAARGALDAAESFTPAAAPAPSADRKWRRRRRSRSSTPAARGGCARRWRRRRASGAPSAARSRRFSRPSSPRACAMPRRPAGGRGPRSPYPTAPSCRWPARRHLQTLILSPSVRAALWPLFHAAPPFAHAAQAACAPRGARTRRRGVKILAEKDL